MWFLTADSGLPLVSIEDAWGQMPPRVQEDAQSFATRFKDGIRAVFLLVSATCFRERSSGRTQGMPSPKPFGPKPGSSSFSAIASSRASREQAISSP